MQPTKNFRPEVLAFVMAGGEGARLHPLTANRCKPSVPFDGNHRIVDFVLSNLVNSGIFSIYLLVQYKSQALIEHVRTSWTMTPFIRDHFVTVVPPQMQHGKEWFQGTADAVAQNLHLIESKKPDLVAVFGADHIYRMDLSQMIAEHLRRNADVSIATLPVAAEQSASFGIVETDDELWVREFHEKPAQAKAMPGRPGHILASMGNYIFSTDVLIDALKHSRGNGEGDFGKHILPKLAKERRVLAYDFTTNQIPGLQGSEEVSYWRDVGTIDAYFEAHFDTLGPAPKFRIMSREWPIYAQADLSGSARIESGAIVDSSIGSGCVIRGARLDRAMLRRTVTVEADAALSECIVMDRTRVGHGARIHRAIIDQDNDIPAGEVIGGNRAHDEKRFHVSEGGVVVVPRGFFGGRSV